MALVLADRVRETTITTGQGSVSLAGAVPGYQTFSVIGNTNTTYYCIAGQGTSEWEVGIGTYTSSGASLSRDTVLASSAGAPTKTNFSAGVKDVFVTYPAERSVYTNETDTTVTVPSLTDSGNLTFTGTGNRITGDFSNSTVANRVMFQTSTVNGASTPLLLPNGTGTTAGLLAFNNSDPTNASFAAVLSLNGAMQISSGISGTGSYQPMTFFIGGSERMRVDTSGRVLVGRTGTFTGSETFVSNGFGSFGSDSAPQVLIGNTGSGLGVLGTFNNYGMEFRTNNTERMRIDTSGNVGIGTNAPAYKLDVAGAISTNNNLTFTGTGNRIIGDFSNATIASRVTFQTSTTNGNTIVRAIPNGTGTVASIQAGNSSDPNNQSAIAINATAAECSINSQINGTGTYLPMTFYTGGSERMRILTDGSISMTTSGSANTTHLFRFNENGGEIILNNNTGNSGTLIDLASGTTRMLHVLSTGNQQIGLGADNTTGVVAFMRAGFAEAMRIDSSGNVGIGTSSPATKLDIAKDLEASRITPASGVAGTAACFATFRSNNRIFYIGNDSSTGGSFGAADASVMWNSAAAPLVFATSNTERARIDSSGNLCVGRSSVGAGDRFVVQTIASGTIMLGYNSSATNTYQVLESGNVLNTNNSYGAISDLRLKENIVDATPKLEKINQVRIVNFNMIDDEQKQIGVVAQELEQIFPSMVEEDSDGIKAVKYSVFVPMLIKAIQEQQVMIEELKAKVAALEEK
jgi:hypothetical protein